MQLSLSKYFNSPSNLIDFFKISRCPNLIELDLYGHRNENLTGKSATSIIQVLSHSLVKLAIPCLAEETKPLGN